MSDPYTVLGVPRDASAKHIAETYRALAQIYHPDRYAEAPPRVRDEASKRMQDLNAAYEQLRGNQPTAARSRTTAAGSAAQPSPPRRGRRRTAPPPREPEPSGSTVLYVDGTRRYHSDDVLPLGLGVDGEETKRITGAAQCGALNSELLKWFRMQRHSATMADKLMFEAWDGDQQAVYTATVGCARVALGKVAAFAAACEECQPPPRTQ